MTNDKSRQSVTVAKMRSSNSLIGEKKIRYLKVHGVFSYGVVGVVVVSNPTWIRNCRGGNDLDGENEVDVVGDDD